MVKQSGKHNFEEMKITVNYSWDLNKLQEWLGEDYHDKEVISYLRFGWPLNAKETERKRSPMQSGWCQTKQTKCGRIFVTGA